MPAGAQPHKAQPAHQAPTPAAQDSSLQRRITELEHEKRALAEKHAKVVNDNRALNGELRHAEQAVRGFAKVSSATKVLVCLSCVCQISCSLLVPESNI